MKKRYQYFLLISILILGFSENIYSQDLIVTTNNDSINCKVLSISEMYEVARNENNMIVTQSIPAATVKKVIIDYYKNIQIQKAVTSPHMQLPVRKNVNENVLSNIQFPDERFRLSANALYAFRYGFGSTSSNIVSDKLIEQLRHNFGLLLDAHIAIGKSRKLMLGIQLGRIQGNASVANVMLNYAGQSYSGTAEMQVNISSIGANVIAPVWHRNKNKTLYLSGGLNYITYYEDFRVDYFNVITQSATFASSIGVMYDYRINRNWGIGCGATIDGGIFTDLYTDVNGNTYHQTVDLSAGIGVGRIVFSGGLRCYL